MNIEEHNKKIGQRIKQMREQLGLSQEELARKIGSSNRSTVSNYEQGNRTFKQSQIALFSKALGTTPAYLMGWEDSPTDDTLPQYPNIYPIKTKRFPLLGEIACGEPIFANEDRESYVEASTDIHADFCLKAHGDSMINARIQDGDIVFIRSQPMVENGEIAAVIINDTATLKRVFFYPKKSQLILQAENPAYAPKIFTGEDINTITILGKAIAFQSDVR